ncbi:MAG: hypothetical protein AABX03_00220 [Nanoarchaeota archaeon]
MNDYKLGIMRQGWKHPRKPTPLDVHGFYLPKIETWNHIWEDVKSNPELNPLIKLVGSVEDLVLDNPTGYCLECDKEFIRFEVGSNGYFMIGLVYCPNNLKHESPEINAWLEVWPNASAGLERFEAIELPVKQKIINRYVLSNPLIRPCYDAVGEFFHLLIESFKKEYDENYKIQPLGVSFRHDVHKSQDYDLGDGI